MINQDWKDYAGRISRFLGCAVDSKFNVFDAVQENKFEHYRIILLDVSDDRRLNGLTHFSDWLKQNMPGILLIATSIQSEYLSRESPQKENYDEKLQMYDPNSSYDDSGRFLRTLREAIMRHGFELPK